MAHITAHRSAVGAVVPFTFDRTPTEGDAARFVNAERGFRQMLHVGDLSQLPNGTAIVTIEASLGAHLFQLDFEYVVGARQLQVFIPDTHQFETFGRVQFVKVPTIDERNLMPNWTGPNENNLATYFEEIGSHTVRVYGVPTPPGMVLFEVPHTSLPAAARNKIIVRDQGDNQAIELLGPGDGCVLRSPNGARWLVRVDDNGQLAVEPR